MLLTITKPTARETWMPFRVRFALLSALLAMMIPTARAQYQPPPPPLTTAPCVPTKKAPCTQPVAPPPTTPSTAERFPFPGETPNDIPSEIDARKPPAPDSPQPAAPQSSEPKPDPGKPAFPFPGEPEGSSSSSSGSSSSMPSDPEPDDSRPALADKGSSGSTRASRRRLPKVEDLDAREARDLEVSHYYVTTGNFQAAYMRAKDAVATIPDDPQAHFAVAETAQHLKKKDEAIAEYTLYLKLEPDGTKSKAAQRALESLTP